MTVNVSVIVVSYRSGSTIGDCLASVASAVPPTTEVVVINNDPTDVLASTVSKLHDATLVVNDTNVGFCAAVNQGIAATTAPYVLLLNPDASVTTDYVARLLDRMDADASIASAGGRVLRMGADGYIDSMGICMERGRRPVDVNHGSADDGRRSGVDERFGVTAAAALYRRSALDAVSVGGQVLPESFFMYIDDVDLAWRLRLAGYRAIVDNAAIAWHGRQIAGDVSGRVHASRRITRKVVTESRRPDYVRERSWVNHLLMLIRNDDPEPFIRQFPYFAMRRMPGDAFGLVQRPIMALRMRARFLALLPEALAARRQIQARRVISAADMARWLP